MCRVAQVTRLPCSVEHGKNVDIAVPSTVGDNVGGVGHNQLACPVDASDSSKRGMVVQVADRLLNTPQDAVGHLLAGLLCEVSGAIIAMTQRAPRPDRHEALSRR
jgi:hypothetical protein